MKFNIGQVTVSIDISEILQGNTTVKLGAPIGKFQLNVDVSIMKDTSMPLLIKADLHTGGAESA